MDSTTVGLPIDHIAVAVHDIEESVKRYETLLGGHVVHRETVSDQGVEVCFIALDADLIELLQPLTSDSPVAKFLQKRGEGLHHIAFRVDDIVAQFDQIAKQGLRILQAAPVRGARDKMIFFVHPSDMGGVLVEFCQPGK